MKLLTAFDECSERSFYTLQILRIVQEGKINEMQWRQWEREPRYFSLSLWCVERPGAERFFFEMTSRSILPTKQPRVISTFSARFQKEGDKTLYLACEVVIALHEEAEIKLLTNQKRLIEKEIVLGVSSAYHGHRILEMKGLSFDEKTAFVQEWLILLVRKFPRLFDHDLLSEDMHYFLLHLKESFKLSHDHLQMSRVIWTLYFFSKELEKKSEKAPLKRHLCFKMRRVKIETPFGSKEVLALFVGLNFLKEHELFEERHLLSAISRFLGEVQAVPDSYFEKENRQNRIHSCYIEIERKNGAVFDLAECRRLKALLPDEMKRCIEQLVPPIFMPRNEEEVMRNILTLSHQLKYSADLPQVILSFEEQTDAEISFTVVLVRILKSGSSSLRELLAESHLSGHLLFDRIKTVGTLRRRYPKEAAVFRIRLPSSDFLRQDYSVDLYSARQWVLHKLQESLGELRDFNGGMIAKQRENFAALKQALGELAGDAALFLQNFFHAIFPVHLSTTLDPQWLKILFQMLLALLESREARHWLEQKLDGRLFLFLKLEDLKLRAKIFASLENLKIPFNELLSVQMQIQESVYLGFIYLEEDAEKQKEFAAALLRHALFDLTFLK